MQVRVKGATLTDIGLVRNKNEDAASIFISENYSIAMVADGIGGHRKGEVASDTTISMISEHMMNNTKEYSLNRVKKIIKAAIKDANKEINRLSVKPEYLNMGTTLVLAVVLEDQTYITYDISHHFVGALLKHTPSHLPQPYYIIHLNIKVVHHSHYRLYIHHNKHLG